MSELGTVAAVIWWTVQAAVIGMVPFSVYFWLRISTVSAEREGQVVRARRLFGVSIWVGLAWLLGTPVVYVVGLVVIL